MKKKIFTVLLSAALVFGTTGGAFGASKISFTSLSFAEASQKLQQIYESYLAKYPDHGPTLKPGASAGEESGSGNAGSSESSSDSSSDNNQPSVSVSQTVSGKQAQVVNLVNKERESRGLSPLATDIKLQKLAQMKAEDMAKKGYFSHTSPTYGSAFDMMAQYGLSYRTAGENIAKGQKTAESVMNGWMNSQGHRANILSNSYMKVGVGYATDEKGTPYWVQMFIG